MEIALLRSATVADHAAVEGSMPLMSSELRLATYVAVLKKTRSIVEAFETLIATAPDQPVEALLAGRSRLECILEDLKTLRADTSDSEACELPPFHGSAELLGALYVMEGSRLGGQLIARHVEETLDLAPGEGTSYFRGFGDQTGRRWKQFLDLLRDEVADADTERVIAGAKKMFAAFNTWMRRDTGPDVPTGNAPQRQCYERRPPGDRKVSCRR